MFKWFLGLSVFKKVRLIICFVLVFTGIVVIVGTEFSNMALTKEYVENNNEITSLTKQLTNINTKKSDKTITKENLTDCKKLGSEVAELQTKYQLYNALDNYDTYVGIADKMDKYLGESSLDARVEWYNMGLGNNKKSWEWHFETNYAFSANKVPVLWTCRRISDNELLAYAVGYYNADTGLFTNIERYNTHNGVTNIVTSEGVTEGVE